ncbi:MAG: UDP-N-acetylmuramate--L-alanine ligase, partial [Elusimicrobia bacterium]|nr:UDP-N-acetylmuramate--L-alanine ligase [Elusimicrobiota bacterium]
MNFEKFAIHMVGIGGSGMSGLAMLLKKMGFRISGSDLKSTAATDELKKEGVIVAVGHNRKNVPDEAKLLVYSSAVNLAANPEIGEARRRGIAVFRRGSILAQLSRMKRAITVSGTHGKTTTSSMIGWILEKAGKRPTVIVGGEIRNIHVSAFLGKGEFFVLETDESDGSFLETFPWIGVVTNVDDDHLEHYGSMAKLEAAFRQHLSQVPFYGWAVLCRDDPVLSRRIIPHVVSPFKTYGLAGRPNCKATGLVKRALGYSFIIEWEGRRVAKVDLAVAGMHNVLNALAGASACHLAGVSWDDIAGALGTYRGIRRRLELVGKYNGITFLDDYGHHPTEIAAAVRAAREFYAKGRLLVCFQPHRFSRTKQLQNKFGLAFAAADFVWVCPIYAASEEPIAGISEDLVIDSLSKAGVVCAKFPGRALDLRKELKTGD